MQKISRVLIVLVSLVLLMQCRKDANLPTPNAPNEVLSRFGLNNFPLDKLSDYGFFEGNMADQNVEEGILPYKVITPLFSDYAHKKRFIWMPEGTQATYTSDHELFEMPEGTLIIKTFYYENVLPSYTTRLMETRLLHKKDGNWEFADYVWNDAQDEAYYTMNGQNIDISFENDFGNLYNVNYRVPSGTECLICHKENDTAFPIGPKPQNLNSSYPFEDGEMNQIYKWVEQGFIDESTLPTSIETVADWEDTSIPKYDRVRAYIDMNCAHCHRAESHCSYRDMRFAWNETEDMTNMGVCMEPDEAIVPNKPYVVSPGNADKSMMYYRLDNTTVSERMPLVGRTVIHEEALVLIREWIEELEGTCN